MAEMNPHLRKISKQYLFPLIEEKLADLKLREPTADVINLGVGDTALPLSPAIVAGIKAAGEEMGTRVIGYGPCNGYQFLRRRIADIEYADFGIEPDEIFISEGINADVCGIQELFSMKQVVGIIDPAYPVYRDLTLSAGRDEIVSIPLTKEFDFLPQIPTVPLDLVYLCSPNNPTGVAMTRDNLTSWVNWAKENNAIIFYDAAYQAFSQNPDTPKTIYEIDGADEVAVEFRSFSKSAGFTGLRLGYVVVPKKIMIQSSGESHPLQPLWKSRQDTKTNGVSYVAQRAGMAALSEEGLTETKAQIKIYQTMGLKMLTAIQDAGYTAHGGIDSPYIWWEVPKNLISDSSSWKFFDYLLNELHILGIPGVGFGAEGEGYIRLSSFATPTIANAFIERIQLVGKGL